jgi:hypothetical protein
MPTKQPFHIRNVLSKKDIQNFNSVLNAFGKEQQQQQHSLLSQAFGKESVLFSQASIPGTSYSLV